MSERAKRKKRLQYKKLNKTRLIVVRTNQHIEASIVCPAGKVLCTMTSKSKKFVSEHKHTGGKTAASIIGTGIAALAKESSVGPVVLDACGYRYHGRIKAVVESAKEAGLEI